MATGEPIHGRILVVDDHEAARYARVQILEEAGHTVLQADTLARAEVLTREWRPELLVLDVNLPDGDGIDFCRRLKGDPDLNGTMVLQMSASFTSSSDMVRGLEAGADGYLVEPALPAVMLATAAALLRLSRAEAALKQLLALEQDARQQAEQANRLKDEFLATLSHELRTPLNAIVGWTTMMRTMNMDEDARRRAIDVIERNAKAQAALIEDLLDVARINEGRLELSWMTVSMPAIVSAAVDSIRPGADARQLKIVTHIPADPRATVRGDPVRLQQVVWNLLVNAVKFTPPGGQITVTLEAGDTHVEVRVKDTGRGISPDFLPVIFERFSRSDAGSTSGGGGLGLGLSIARQITVLHKGTLTASSPGEHQGAEFVLRLPYPTAAAMRVTQG